VCEFVESVSLGHGRHGMTYGSIWWR